MTTRILMLRECNGWCKEWCAFGYLKQMQSLFEEVSSRLGPLSVLSVECWKFDLDLVLRLVQDVIARHTSY